MTTRAINWPYASRVEACIESILCKKIKLFNFFGIECFLSSSVVIIPACLALSGNLDWGVGIYVLGVAVSVFIHELGHALGGWFVGNPAKQICLVACGGYTTFYNTPGVTARDALMSFAGPMANGLIFVLLVWIEGSLSGGMPTDQLPFSSVLLNAIAHVNACMFIFNLLPAFPLDGGRIFRWLCGCIMPSRKAAFVTMLVARTLACMIVGRSLMTDLIVSFAPIDLGIGIIICIWIWYGSKVELWRTRMYCAAETGSCKTMDEICRAFGEESRMEGGYGSR